MAFVVVCAACGKRLNIPDALYQGKIRGRIVTIGCKQCGADISVDGTKESSSEESTPRAADDSYRLSAAVLEVPNVLDAVATSAPAAPVGPAVPTAPSAPSAPVGAAKGAPANPPAATATPAPPEAAPKPNPPLASAAQGALASAVSKPDLSKPELAKPASVKLPGKAEPSGLSKLGAGSLRTESSVATKLGTGKTETSTTAKLGATKTETSTATKLGAGSLKADTKPALTPKTETSVATKLGAAKSEASAATKPGAGRTETSTASKLGTGSLKAESGLGLGLGSKLGQAKTETSTATKLGTGSLRADSALGSKLAGAKPENAAKPGALPARPLASAPKVPSAPIAAGTATKPAASQGTGASGTAPSPFDVDEPDWERIAPGEGSVGTTSERASTEASGADAAPGDRDFSKRTLGDTPASKKAGPTAPAHPTSGGTGTGRGFAPAQAKTGRLPVPAAKALTPAAAAKPAALGSNAAAHKLDVRGTSPGTPVALKRPEESSPRAAGAPEARESLWAVSFADDDDREMTVREIEAALESGEIDADTIVWREGMEDWLPLSEVAELRPLVAHRISAAPMPGSVRELDEADLEPAESLPRVAAAPNAAGSAKASGTQASSTQASGSGAASAAKAVAEPTRAAAAGELEDEPTVHKSPDRNDPLYDEPTLRAPIGVLAKLALDGQTQEALLRSQANRSSSGIPPLPGGISAPPFPSSPNLNGPQGSGQSRHDPLVGAFGAPPGAAPLVDLIPPSMPKGAPPMGLSSLPVGPVSGIPSVIPGLNRKKPVWIVVGVLVLAASIGLIALISSAFSSSADPAASVDPHKLAATAEASDSGERAAPPGEAEAAPVAAGSTDLASAFEQNVGKTASSGSAGPAFDRKMAEAQLKVAAARATLCRKKGEEQGPATASLTFDPASGRATRIAVEGRYANTPTGRCIELEMKSVRVRPFSGAPVTLQQRVMVR
jgi:hypothetical protein